MIDEMSEANSVAGHCKMKLHCNQDFPQSENTSKIGRTILLMFTLGGFGGAPSLYTAEAMIDLPSNDDTAGSCSSALEKNQ
jgi:hypothetical protein